MLKKTTFTIPIIALAIFLFASISQAMGPGPHPGEMSMPPMGEMKMPCMGGDGIMPFADDLNLTDDQLAKIRDIRVEKRKKSVDLNADLEKAKIEMRELWDNGIPNQKAVDKKIDQISSIKAKIRKIAVASRIDELKVLTSEQLDKLNELKLKRFFFRGKGKMMGREHRMMMQRAKTSAKASF